MAKKKAAKKATKRGEQPSSGSPAVGSRFRNRIKELRMVPAGELLANPKNWRTHPDEQRSALLGVLEEVGWAGAAVARETPGGPELIDGHLRADMDPQELVPVLITDLSELEANKLNLVFDPIGDLAGVDKEKLREMLDAVQFSNEDLAAIATQLAEDNDIITIAEESGGGGGNAAVPEVYQLVIDCKDQDDQKTLLEEIEKRGYECRVVTL